MPSKTGLGSDAKISISSVTELHSHFDELYDDLHAPETEHTWQKIERALLHIQAITRGGATKYHPEFVALIKDAGAGPINNALLSERTKLSGTAGDLMNSIAPRLAEKFEGLVGVFVPTLLLICARTNKVAVKRAEKTLHLIVKHCRPPSLVPYLKEAIKDKGQGLRAVAAGTLELVLEYTEKERLTRKVADIEACIKSGATDSNPEVRQTTKRLFELYVSIWPERVEQFTKPMTPTIRRYLSLPKTGALHVEVPEMTATVQSTRQVASHTSAAPQQSRYEAAAAIAPTAAAPRSTTSSYSFFPDLPKASSSSSAYTSAARPPTGPGFNMNDATYAKRGLFADQIAAARSARLARVPSYNFDDMPKADPAPVQHSLKRQPSFEQIRSHGPQSSVAAFRVPRFDVVVPSRQDSEGSRPRGYEPAAYAHGNINANTPAFASASGLHGKSALLAAYKQAFVGDIVGAKPSSSSSSANRERRVRDRSEKPRKHSDDRREKTVTVRFGPEIEDQERDPQHYLQDGSSGADAMRRSRSAPQIALQSESDAAGDDSDVDAASPTESVREQKSGTKAAKSGQASSSKKSDDFDSDEEERPSTPPDRILHAQTPRTGVKASRVPAQRVIMPSAVKVSAMRVGAPTPSAKVAATRVVAESASVESSPIPKSRTAPASPRLQPTEAESEPLTAEQDNPKQSETTEQAEKGRGEEKTEPVKAEEAKKKEPAVAKKPAAVAASAAKPAPRPVVTKVAAVKPTPAQLAAKARLEARAAKEAAAAAAAAASRKTLPRPATTALKPAVPKRPVASTTAPPKTAGKPTAPASTSAKVSKPAVVTKANPVTSTAMARAKLAATTKPAAASAPSAILAAKKAEIASTTRTSSLTASTASTRNKVVPAATVKKFQPTKPSSLSSSSLVSKPRPKSSIAASLTAKSKLVGAQAGASDKANAVRKAGATMAARIEKHRRDSAAAGPTCSNTAPLPPSQVSDAGSDKEAVAETAMAQRPSPAAAQEQVVVEQEHSEEDTERKDEVSVEAESETAVTGSDAILQSADSQDKAAQPNEPELEPEAPVEPTTLNEDEEIAAQQDTVEEVRSSEATAPPSEEDVLETSTVYTQALEPVSDIGTAIRTPSVTQIGTPAMVRTPLGSKDQNLPKASPNPTVTHVKTASPLSVNHIRAETRSTPASSPLRRTATPKQVVRIPQFEQESSSEDENNDESISESESESEDETDEVVQLHFRPRPVVQASPVKLGAANKQLVLGIDSSSDTSMMEASESDETVLLEQAA